ncbi:Hypothetical predicted protein [Mytilus galloprovincialis]|uniref:Uncharacterized protein n=1 Tax=Mytilus galloprovincialis TaxID=29158 RepID=A0A8B6EKP5_MYTGA|nr:Hypothetical predicted protein [Mytilus galloprovincialis]
MIVSGPTSCGKTHFVAKVLREAEAMCEPAPQRIVWLYKRWQPLYDVVRDGVHPPVEFVRGIPPTWRATTSSIRETHPEKETVITWSSLTIRSIDSPWPPWHDRCTRVDPNISATIRRGHEKTTRLSPCRRQTGDPRDGETAHERPDGAVEEEETTQTEETTTNDLIACEECGLVFVHRRGLEEHACSREEEERISKARRLDSSEDTSEYDTDEDILPMSDAELEEEAFGRVTGGRTLCRRVTRRHLAPTDDLCRQHGYLRWTGEALGGVSLSIHGTGRILRFTRTFSGVLPSSLQGTCSSPMDLNTDSVRLKCNRDHPIRADSIVYIS